MSKIPLDVVYVIDATSSSQGIISTLRDRCQNISACFGEKYGRRVNPCYGCVLMRDPVDNDGRNGKEMDEHEFLQLSPSFEPMELFLGKADEEIKHDGNETKYLAYGGGDEPEDWVGALRLAIENTDWRPSSKKMIIMLTDADAHGRKYCGYENHQEEEPKLAPLFTEMANQSIYFVGINIKRGGGVVGDYNIPMHNGCERTLRECKEVYDSNGGRDFLIEDFVIERNEDGTINLDEYEDNVVDLLQQTIVGAFDHTAVQIMATMDFPQ